MQNWANTVPERPKPIPVLPCEEVSPHIRYRCFAEADSRKMGRTLPERDLAPRKLRYITSVNEEPYRIVPISIDGTNIPDSYEECAQRRFEALTCLKKITSLSASMNILDALSSLNVIPSYACYRNVLYKAIHEKNANAIIRFFEEMSMVDITLTKEDYDSSLLLLYESKMTVQAVCYVLDHKRIPNSDLTILLFEECLSSCEPPFPVSCPRDFYQLIRESSPNLLCITYMKYVEYLFKNGMIEEAIAVFKDGSVVGVECASYISFVSSILENPRFDPQTKLRHCVSMLSTANSKKSELFCPEVVCLILNFARLNANGNVKVLLYSFAIFTASRAMERTTTRTYEEILHLTCTFEPELCKEIRETVLPCLSDHEPDLFLALFAEMIARHGQQLADHKFQAVLSNALHTCSEFDHTLHKLLALLKLILQFGALSVDDCAINADLFNYHTSKFMVPEVSEMDVNFVRSVSEVSTQLFATFLTTFYEPGFGESKPLLTSTQNVINRIHAFTVRSEIEFYQGLCLSSNNKATLVLLDSTAVFSLTHPHLRKGFVRVMSEYHKRDGGVALIPFTSLGELLSDKSPLKSDTQNSSANSTAREVLNLALEHEWFRILPPSGVFEAFYCNLSHKNVPASVPHHEILFSFSDIKASLLLFNAIKNIHKRIVFVTRDLAREAVLKNKLQIKPVLHMHTMVSSK